jgi:HD-GYP domain-containing protein (c-di-GMP phosphodiesterase class II)
MNQTSRLDKMSLEIALNHHERWNGEGYPGNIRNIMQTDVEMGPPKKAAEIPLIARIVCLADVFDALISQRCYKESWSDAQALEAIAAESGKQFDPELVEIFFEILPVIQAIRLKYRD